MSSAVVRGQDFTRLFARGVLFVALTWALGGCSGARGWNAERSPRYDESEVGDFVPPDESSERRLTRYRVRSIGALRPENPVENPGVVTERIALARTEGRVLGEFRNTYYDFPSEAEYSGDWTPLYNERCAEISKVRKDFHDAVCVQGSGVLMSGVVVSFAKRNCSCAVTCPRTEQKICYESLDRHRFPWGRGATGKAVTPLLTVAVDSDVVPLGTAVYIPQFEGLPRDIERSSVHDGCFVAQDRGLKVKGKHVDVFMGEPAMTRLWNRLVPSNQGVTEIVGSPKCER